MATNPITRAEAEVIFGGNDLDQIRPALFRVAFYEPDYVWAQDHCLVFCHHPNAEVRGVAAICLGHIARLHGRLDLEKVMPVLQRLLADPPNTGQVEEALDDIQQFVR